MRQVPQYTIIGNGRLAQHMICYFKQLNLKFSHWYRQQSIQALKTACHNATHILLLISDSHIDPFIQQHHAILNAATYLIHCSAALRSQYAHTAHPLQTFSHTLYDAEEYHSIPFIIEQSGPAFEHLLPGLTNPHYAIPTTDKPYYHALCVMANNFTTLLWQQFFNTLEQDFNIPAQAGMPILKQTFANLNADYRRALTGPIARNDLTTLKNNRHALQQHNNYADIFDAFIKTHVNPKEKQHEHP